MLIDYGIKERGPVAPPKPCLCSIRTLEKRDSKQGTHTPSSCVRRPVNERSLWWTKRSGAKFTTQSSCPLKKELKMPNDGERFSRVSVECFVASPEKKKWSLRHCAPQCFVSCLQRYIKKKADQLLPHQERLQSSRCTK